MGATIPFLCKPTLTRQYKERQKDCFKADDPAYSTRSWTGGVMADHEMGRMTLSTGIEVARLQADERLLLLPEARRDRLTRFHIGAVYRQLTVGGLLLQG